LACLDECDTNQKAAFEKWVGIHSQSIERFAFQYGCSPEQAREVTEDIFRALNNLEIIDETETTTLYKITMEKLSHIQQSTSHLDGIFPFEEDAKLHSEIIELDEKYRIPLVLHRYHGLKDEQIAIIIDVHQTEIKSRIRTAKKIVSEKIKEPSIERMEKRLTLLGKSYERLPALFRFEQVMQKKELTMNKQNEIERKKKNRKGRVWAIVLGVLLVGLVTGTFFTGEEWELRKDRKYIENLKKDFAVETKKRQEILGVSDDVFNSIFYFELAKSQFEGMIIDFEKMNSEGEKIDRQLADDFLVEIIASMKLPSELVEELFAAPLTNNLEKSLEFISKYIEKSYMIRHSFYGQFAIDYEKLNNAIVDGKFDIEYIRSRKEDFSESTIIAIEALASQNIPPLSYITKEGVIVNTMNSEFIGRLRSALHESVGGHLTQYEKEPFVMEGKLLYSIDQTFRFIEEMEQTVIAEREINGESAMEGLLIHLLDTVIKGGTIGPLLGSDGSISEEHRKVWKQFASLGPESGVGVIMTKIVDEMEESDWKTSEFYSSIDDWRIHEAYGLAINGELDNFIADEFVPMSEVFEERTTAIQDLEQDTLSLYNEFTVSYDRALLKKMHPLLIVSLFYLANDMEDPVTMWHLTDPDTRTPAPEEYANGWKKEVPLLEKTNSIHFDPSMIMDDRSITKVPIEFNRNGKKNYNLWMTYAKDQVWQVEAIVLHEGNL
jgi:hypothetical protein